MMSSDSFIFQSRIFMFNVKTFRHLSYVKKTLSLTFGTFLRQYLLLTPTTKRKHKRSIYVLLLQHNGNSNYQCKEVLSLRIKSKARQKVCYFILILFQKSQLKQLEAHLSSCFAQQFNIQGDVQVPDYRVNTVCD